MSLKNLDTETDIHREKRIRRHTEKIPCEDKDQSEGSTTQATSKIDSNPLKDTRKDSPYSVQRHMVQFWTSKPPEL